jgi:hypothetical protein
MAKDEINERTFANLVLSEFPRLCDALRESEGLCHLQMMEFRLFTLEAANNGDWTTVAKSLEVADNLMRHGDARVKNSIYVSYLEHFPRQGEIRSRLRQMMTTELRQSWDDSLGYLEQLLGKDSFDGRVDQDSSR